MDKWLHPTLYWACDYLSMLGLKLNQASKRDPKPPLLCFYIIVLTVSTHKVAVNKFTHTQQSVYNIQFGLSYNLLD